MGINDLLGPGIKEQWESVYGSSQTATSIMAQQANAQNQISAMQHQMTANAAMGVSPYQNVYGVGTSASGLSVTGTVSAGAGWSGFRMTGLNKADLDHPLYDVPVSILKNLWGAKFGMRWVSLEELEELDDLDKSWLTTFRRLRAMVMLENANTIDTNRQLYRLPPE